MRFVHERHRKILTALLGVVLLGVVTGIQTDWRLRVDGHVLPQRLWTLVFSQEGLVSSCLWDEVEGFALQRQVWRPERGGDLQVKLDLRVLAGGAIASGDTLAVLSSSELERRINQLQEDMASARAELALRETGEKAPVIQEAETNYRLAQSRAEFQRSVAAREDSLYQRRLVSREAYESALTLARLAELEAQVAQAQLESARTGDKPELLRQIQAGIDALQRESEVVRGQIERQVIRSPIPGLLRRHCAGDTLLRIESQARLARLPVPAGQLGLIRVGMPVAIVPPRPHVPAQGVVVGVDSVLCPLGDALVGYVTALWDADSHLPSYLPVQGRITLARLPVWRHVWRYIRAIWSA